MTIASQLEALQTDITNARTVIATKGGTVTVGGGSSQLATDIATIPSGGGGATMRGAWPVPQPYLDLEEEMTGTDTYLNALRAIYDTGIGANYNSYVGAMGFILPPETYSYTTTLYKNPSGNAYMYGFRTSDGSYYDATEISETTTTITHTFDHADDLDGGHKWIICYYYLDQNDGTYQSGQITDSYGGYINGSSGSTITSIATYTVVNARIQLNRFLGSTRYPHINSFYLVNKDDIHNTPLSLVANVTAFNYASSSTDYTFRKYIPSCEELGLSGSAFTGLTSASNFSNYYQAPNLPYGYDMSAITSDVTIGGVRLNGNTSTLYMEAYITLPSVNVTFYSGTILSGKNLAYIAEHAPTVSGKTLTIGSDNVARMGGTSSTIYTTLTDKGWTIA